MKQEITLDWQGKMQFQAHVGNHSITLDGSPEVGGEDAGARPKPLMLVALAGCSGMDVVSLLRKMSMDTYCGVAQVYKKALPVTYEIQVKEQ